MMMTTGYALKCPFEFTAVTGSRKMGHVYVAPDGNIPDNVLDDCEQVSIRYRDCFPNYPETQDVPFVYVGNNDLSMKNEGYQPTRDTLLTAPTPTQENSEMQTFDLTKTSNTVTIDYNVDDDTPTTTTTQEDSAAMNLDEMSYVELNALVNIIRENGCKDKPNRRKKIDLINFCSYYADYINCEVADTPTPEPAAPTKTAAKTDKTAAVATTKVVDVNYDDISYRDLQRLAKERREKTGVKPTGRKKVDLIQYLTETHNTPVASEWKTSGQNGLLPADDVNTPAPAPKPAKPANTAFDTARSNRQELRAKCKALIASGADKSALPRGLNSKNVDLEKFIADNEPAAAPTTEPAAKPAKSPAPKPAASPAPKPAKSEPAASPAPKSANKTKYEQLEARIAALETRQQVVDTKLNELTNLITAMHEVISSM